MAEAGAGAGAPEDVASVLVEQPGEMITGSVTFLPQIMLREDALDPYLAHEA